MAGCTIPRFPVQLQVGSFGIDNAIHHTLYALAKDGSMWKHEKDEWIRIKDLPSVERTYRKPVTVATSETRKGIL